MTTGCSTTSRLPDLLSTGDLAWVDELDDDDVAAAEAWLARKKS